MKRLLALLLASMLVLSSTACGAIVVEKRNAADEAKEKEADKEKDADEDAVDEDEDTEPVDETEAETEAETEKETEEETEEETEKETEEETKPANDNNSLVLVDENDIKITAKSIEYPDSSYYGAELKLLIENNSDKELTFSSDYVSINGYMVSESFYCTVAAGKKANEKMSFYASELIACGITAIADMDIIFNVYDSNYDTYLYTDPITIFTDAADSYQYKYDASGILVLQERGVKVVFKRVLQADDDGGPAAIFYVHNNTDKYITFASKSISVNGFMVSGSFSPTIAPGKHYIGELTLYKSDLAENYIETIENIEVSFKVRETGTYDYFIDSDPTILNF